MAGSWERQFKRKSVRAPSNLSQGNRPAPLPTARRPAHRRAYKESGLNYYTRPRSVSEKCRESCHREKQSDEAIQLDRHDALRAPRDDKGMGRRLRFNLLRLADWTDDIGSVVARGFSPHLGAQTRGLKPRATPNIRRQAMGRSSIKRSTFARLATGRSKPHSPTPLAGWVRPRALQPPEAHAGRRREKISGTRAAGIGRYHHL